MEPNEIVERYVRPQSREVVERYTRPLPPSLLPPKPKRSRRGLYIFLLLMWLLVVAAAVSWALPRFFPLYDEADEAPYTVDHGVDLPRQEDCPVRLTLAESHGEALTPQEIYARVNPAVVTVSVLLNDGMGIGTGVLFHPDGYLLTNYHVVEGGQRCTVQLADGRSFDAFYVTGDWENDLAVLKIDGQNLPTAVLGSSDELTVGDPAYAIGNPLGVELRGTFTDGMISAIDRDVRVGSTTMTLLQTTAALNSGNSGGPLIDQYGQVVGINTIKMSAGYSETSVEGLGFAIPTSAIRTMVNDLLDYGSVLPQPTLGVTVSQIGDALPNGQTGILVREVTAGGAADRAGVQVGDYILSAAGTPTPTSAELLRARRDFTAGGEMELVLWRDGETLTVTLSFPKAAQRGT